MKKAEKKKMQSYKVVEKSLPPLPRYIPIDKKEREELYEAFKNEFGYSMPDYSEFKRDHMSLEDMSVLWDEWWRVYKYRGGLFKITCLPGYCWDRASVPLLLNFASLSKTGQHVQEEALPHDVNFAEKLWPFTDANIIFRAGILHKAAQGIKRAKRSDGRYYFGVSSFIGKKLYNKGTPGKNWFDGFYKMEVLRECEW